MSFETIVVKQNKKLHLSCIFSSKKEVNDNERITCRHFHSKKGTEILGSVYAQTLYAYEQVKNVYYEKLNQHKA